MRVLFLDDNPNRHDVCHRNLIGVVTDHVFSSDQAIDSLEFIRGKNIEYSLIMLDHDLSETDYDLHQQGKLGTENNGQTVAKYMADKCDHLPRDVPIVIHSLNSAGAMAMQSLLKAGGFTNVYVMPFAWRYIQLVKDEDRSNPRIVFKQEPGRSNWDTDC